MTEQQLTAMEQALEALYPISHNSTDDYRGQANKAITALRTAIEQAKRQQALDKMAENERELGIQMQPGPAEWNKSIRDGVDSLLAQSGFEPDSSARHQLAMMNFESTTVQLKNWRNVLPGGRMTDEWESARAGDYNRGWNDYRKAAKAVLEKLEATPPAAQRQWVGLNEDELKEIFNEPDLPAFVVESVRAIEAKLRAVNGFSCEATEKNGG